MMARKGWRRVPALVALLVFAFMQPTFICGLDCMVHRMSGTQMSATAQHALVAPCHGQQLTHKSRPPLSPVGMAPIPATVRAFHTPVVRVSRTVRPVRQVTPPFRAQDPPPPRA